MARFYLQQKTQGKGIGKMLFTWLEQKALKKGYFIVWLAAIDAKPQAF